MQSDFIAFMLPLFLLICGGYVFTRLYKLSEDTLVRIVTDFFMPVLIFHSLYSADIQYSEIFRLAGATILVISILFLLSLIYCSRSGIKFNEFAPPVLFMNSGFIGIPLMKLWGGLNAMNAVVVYDQVQSFILFTLGLVIVTGRASLSGLKEILISPIPWSIVLAFGFKFMNISVPYSLMNAFQFCGEVAPPLAIFALGCSLCNQKITVNLHLVTGLCIRFGCGLAAGWAACLLFGITGTTRTVVMVASSLPSAVFTGILPVRYGIDARYATGMIVTSTLLSFVTIPFAFYLSGL